jgi:hypothetical protein
MADGVESGIEQLAESLDRCRKAMTLAKVIIAAGEFCRGNQEKAEIDTPLLLPSLVQ